MLLTHPQVPCSHCKSTLLVNYTFDHLGDEHTWNAQYSPVSCTTFPKFCILFGLLCPVISRGEINKVKWGKRENWISVALHSWTNPSQHPQARVSMPSVCCQHSRRLSGHSTALCCIPHISQSLLFDEQQERRCTEPNPQGSYSWLLVLHGTTRWSKCSQRFRIQWGSGRSCWYWMGTRTLQLFQK